MNDNTVENKHQEGFLLNLGALYSSLQKVKDQRHARGQRYELATLLLVVILAKLSGEDKPTGIAEWIRWRGTELQHYLGSRRKLTPSHNTIRRLMQSSVAEEDLQKQMRQYLHQSYGGQQSLLVVIDGKTLRGTIPQGARQGVHLLAAYLPQEEVVLFQLEVGQKENEITAAPRLLTQLDLKGRVVSGDAMFTQRQLSIQVLAQGGHYLWQVKENQPQLLEDIQRFFQPLPQHPRRSNVPQPSETIQQITKKRGRVEIRTLTTLPDSEQYVQWPGLQQLFRLERQVYTPQKKRSTFEQFYGITSLPFAPGSAAQLLDYTRSHWKIENQLHYRRDVTLQEDATRMKSTSQARVLATLNNFLIALTHHLGFQNLPSARRFFQFKLDMTLALANP